MKKCQALTRLIIVALAAMLISGGAQSKEGQPHVKVAVGGASSLSYLPTMLAAALGAYDEAGVDVEIIDFKGGSVALTSVLGGSADVVSGFYDHCIDIVPKGKQLVSLVVFDRFLGIVLTVSPTQTAAITSIKDLGGKKVGVSAPGSSTDFFLKFLLRSNGMDPDKTAVIGVGLDATAVAAMEQGSVDAASMVDPALTQLQARHKDLRILTDTRTREDTMKAFGGEYPSGSLYAQDSWIKAHPREAQSLAEAIVRTLKWMKGHSAEEITAKMPPQLVGENRDLYLAALKATRPMYSETGLMDQKGSEVVLKVLSQSLPDVAAAHVDLATTYTNEYVSKALAKLGAAP
jgi:NitT/TauT family transport system substrate-binding protein